MNPRKPTEEEKKELKQIVIEKDFRGNGRDNETVENSVNNAAIAVFDHYTTDSYSGKVMVVVWPGSPGTTETYIWNKEKIEICPSET